MKGIFVSGFCPSDISRRAVHFYTREYQQRRMYRAWGGASRWVTYHDGLFEIENRPGTYVIFMDGELIYIGSSEDVGRRVASQGIPMYSDGPIRTRWGVSRDVVVKVKYSDKFGDWLMLEARLIFRLQPKFNRRGRFV